MEPGGPSIAQLQAGAAGADPGDVGAGTAANLYANQAATQMRYAEPAHFQAERSLMGMPQTDVVSGVDYGDGQGVRAAQPGIPTSYNLSAPYPAKYDLPNPQKHRMAIKQALRDTAPNYGPGGLR